MKNFTLRKKTVHVDISKKSFPLLKVKKNSSFNPVNYWSLLFLFLSLNVLAQSAGFNTTFISINNGSSDVYYDLQATTGNPDFNGANLGTFCAGATTGLTFKGAEHNIYKCGGCDLTSTRLYYRIYSGSPSGSFISNNVNYFSGANNGCGGQDQQWKTLTYNVNLLNSLSSGSYTMEVYSDASVTCSGGTVYATNGGSNYKATFTVVAVPSISAQPSSASICVGGTYSPTVTASGGTPSLTYQWQYSADGSTGWANVANGTPTNSTYSNATSASSFSVTGNIAAGSYYYRCIASATGSGCSSATSSNGVLTVVAVPSISAQPSSASICVGGTYSPTVTASGGTPSLTYQWQYSANGSTGWANVANGTPTNSTYSNATSAS
ncbi:type II and III secretion system protein family protein, partial [Flavobacterium psychrotolerans]